MSAPEYPQLYLITPPSFELSEFADRLAHVLDNVSVACLRLDLAQADEDHIIKVADTLREIAHNRDIPIIISQHMQLAERLGLDGVHLIDGARSVRAARKLLGSDAIIGSYCGQSRHDGMSAGEAGADYISVGPVTHSALGDGSVAEQELFAWWSEMIEIPVVAEGGLDQGAVKTLAEVTDFFGVGAEIWDSADPVKALQKLMPDLPKN